MIVQHTGKWIDATCEQFLFCLFSCLLVPQPPTRIAITTDGNPQYLTALMKCCQEFYIDYGRVIKYHKGNRLAAVIREKVLGNLAIASISTSIVEGYNNKIWQRISRFARKTAAFSKTIIDHTRAMDLFQLANNSIDAKGGTTPGVREGITDHVWAWQEFLAYHFQLHYSDEMDMIITQKDRLLYVDLFPIW